MAAIQKPFQFGKDICKIFGLDPLTTKSITIKIVPVSYTHLRAHETVLDLVCRLLLETKK